MATAPALPRVGTPYAFVLLLVLAVASACEAVSPTPAPVATPSAVASASPSLSPTLPPSPSPPSPAATATPSRGATVDPEALAEQLIAPGWLVVCTDFGGPPTAFRDAEGRARGINVEMGEAIATHLALEPDIRETVFTTLIDAVAGHACDASISSQHITSTRLERIDMVPYTQGAQHVVVPAGRADEVADLTDLCGTTLAVQSGSTHVDLVLGQGDHAGAGLDQQCVAAGRPPVDLRQFADDRDAVTAVIRGDADAYIGNDFVTEDERWRGRLELAAALPPIRQGIGVAKDRPVVRAAVEAALAVMFTDTTYLDVLRKYGVQHLSILE